MEMPELPEPFRASGAQISYDGDDRAFCDLFNREQMREYGAAVREACARIVDGVCPAHDQIALRKVLASAIRSNEKT